ncbi:MAG TPA: DNA repair protein RecN [Steroidobacteraceae bacterium]
MNLKDLVIVDQAELDLASGMTALTGETGAGKSIIVDALLLIAGGRAGSDIVREGAERAEITASFVDLPKAVKSWLEAQAIEVDDELIVRRLIGADGRSRAYVNGQMVPLQSLKELAEHLIDIHGQQEFQRLTQRGAQRGLLDDRLGDAKLLDQVAEIFERYRQCRSRFDELSAAAQNRDARLDLLRYQVQELKAEVTSVSEIEALFIDQKRIAGKSRLGAAARSALSSVYEADEGSAHELLGKASSALRALSESDPELGEALKLLGEASIAAQEAAGILSRYLERLDIDPARQEEIERRAAALESLARKHRVTVTELPAQLERLDAELSTLENAGTSLTALEKELGALAADYRNAAAQLTQAREKAAKALARDVTKLMQALGMAGGSFSVSLATEAREFSREGQDQVEFLVSANPGQPLRGLAKVASGGELSRISLAVQVAALGKASSLCMVFDEVDAGIGGAVAEIVGRRLRDLGERNQVLCVTHLAQVASQAHRQFRVSKLTDGKITRTSLKGLAPQERVDEIARMLGGIDITDQARAHAKEMLKRGAAA